MQQRRVAMQCKGDGAGCWCRTSQSRSRADLTGGADIGALILAGGPQSAVCAEDGIDPAGLQ